MRTGINKSFIKLEDITMNTEKKLSGYPSIDKPWLKYHSEEAIYVTVPDCIVCERISVTVNM